MGDQGGRSIFNSQATHACLELALQEVEPWPGNRQTTKQTRIGSYAAAHHDSSRHHITKNVVRVSVSNKLSQFKGPNQPTVRPFGSQSQPALLPSNVNLEPPASIKTGPRKGYVHRFDDLLLTTTSPTHPYALHDIQPRLKTLQLLPPNTVNFPIPPVQLETARARR